MAFNARPDRILSTLNRHISQRSAFFTSHTRSLLVPHSQPPGERIPTFPTVYRLCSMWDFQTARKGGSAVVSHLIPVRTDSEIYRCNVFSCCKLFFSTVALKFRSHISLKMNVYLLMNIRHKL